jgi:hypothetical protein
MGLADSTLAIKRPFIVGCLAKMIVGNIGLSEPDPIDKAY